MRQLSAIGCPLGRIPERGEMADSQISAWRVMEGRIGIEDRGAPDGAVAGGWWLGAPAIIKLAFFYIWGTTLVMKGAMKK